MKLSSNQISELIISMAEKDQGARFEKPINWSEVGLVDKQNNKDIKKLVNEYGLIGIAEYGAEASSKAWLLIQHMSLDELPFMKKYLKYMSDNLNDIDIKNYAYLTDRICTYEGLPQIYGTQLKSSDDSTQLEFFTINNLKTIDEQRKEIGLDSLGDYAESMAKMCSQKVILPKGY